MTTMVHAANPQGSEPARVYFDNAATSFPKPPRVHAAMAEYATHLGASPGRGAYREARASADLLACCRAAIAELIGSPSPDHVIFTLNTTDALNLGIRGLVEPAVRAAGTGRGVHVVTTAMDHNSVLRPLNALVDRLGIRQTVVRADMRTGLVDPADVAAAIGRETVLVAAVHASNVSGTVQDIASIGRVCRAAGVPLLVDAAQSLGHLPVDVEAMGIDLLAAPGHKGLLGPLGTGFLAIRPGLEDRLETVREGGTGSRSESATQPEDLPDKYEPGSHNTIGIAGLLAGVEYLLERTIADIRRHERTLMDRFLQGFAPLMHNPEQPLTLLGTTDLDHRVGVFSVHLPGIEPPDLADALERDFGLLTRPGLHCAPHAHRTLPSTVLGATRFSLGPFHTEADIDVAVEAVSSIASRFQDAAVGV